MFLNFTSFLDTHKRLPAFTDTEQGEPVGRWFQRVLSLRETGQLAPELQQQFEQIENWSWPQADTWFELFEELEQSWPVVEEEGAANWIELQGDMLCNGQLSCEKISLLESLEAWSWPVQAAHTYIAWMKDFEQLCQWINTHGELPPFSPVPGGVNLGEWLSKQRRDLKTGQLSAWRQHMLDRLYPDYPGG